MDPVTRGTTEPRAIAIATTPANSTAIAKRGMSTIAIVITSAASAVAFTIYGSFDGSTWYKLKKAGSDYTETLSQNEGTTLDSTVVAGFPLIAVVAAAAHTGVAGCTA